MTQLEIFEAQLQQLGARKAKPSEFPQMHRWGNKYVVYTSLSGARHLFIFLGKAGAVRTGTSPAFSISALNLRDKLLARHKAQQDAKAATQKMQRNLPPLSIEDFS